MELPTLKGEADTTFRYNGTLENDGDEELSVNLIAEAPEGFEVDFKLTSKAVSSFPIAPGESKRLDIEVQPPDEPPGMRTRSTSWPRVVQPKPVRPSLLR